LGRPGAAARISEKSLGRLGTFFNLENNKPERRRTMERDQASKFINDLLKLMISRNGSDLFITGDFPPAIKVDGKVTKVSPQPLSGAHTMALARSIMNDKQAAEFERTKECNFAVAPPGVGRFRVNAFIQQGKVGMVMRTIPATLPTIDSLGLPPVLKDVTMTKRGLVILVGATGSGKSTSLAAMVDHRNDNSFGHIITIEDPVEFVHPHKNCVVTQREVGLDTDSWEAALKNALRQAPDVILMGEVRDRETMEHAVAFAETGHLCMCTLHANSANQALDRIINFFPEERRAQLLMDLSLNLRAMVSQRLVPNQDGKGRFAAVEVMLNTPLISDLIFKGEVGEIKEIMKKSRNLGMQTFDQALFDGFENNKISFEDALRNADSVNDLRLQIKLNSQRAKTTDLAAGTEHLAIV
jgi:twitching motility protein PilU